MPPSTSIQFGEADRKEHVVVDGVGLRAVALRPLKERALAQARAALNETHLKHSV